MGYAVTSTHVLWMLRMTATMTRFAAIRTHARMILTMIKIPTTFVQMLMCVTWMGKTMLIQMDNAETRTHAHTTRKTMSMVTQSVATLMHVPTIVTMMWTVIISAVMLILVATTLKMTWTMTISAVMLILVLTTLNMTLTVTKFVVTLTHANLMR